MEPDTIALILTLIISIILHEVGHAYAASALGDPTARLEGRLSVNPIVHIDPMMSVVVPALTIIMSGGSFVFGGAKPVPYNPYNFSNQKWGEALVAFAGPLVNITLAVIFAATIPLAAMFGLPPSYEKLAASVVLLNLFLAFFNLVPIPPLDGSKILPRFLPFALRMKYDGFRRQLEQNAALAFGLVIILFIFVLGAPLAQFTSTVATFLISAFGG